MAITVRFCLPCLCIVGRKANTPPLPLIAWPGFVGLRVSTGSKDIGHMRFSAYASQCILMIRWFIGRCGWLSEGFRVRPEALNGALFARTQFFKFNISNGKAETGLEPYLSAYPRFCLIWPSVPPPIVVPLLLRLQASVKHHEVHLKDSSTRH